MSESVKYAVLWIAVPPPCAPKTAMRAFAKVDNREVFMRSIEIYANRDEVSQRVLCVGTDDLQTIQSKFAAHLGFQGVNVTAGGPDWFSVVARGLEKLKPEINRVFIHDVCCPAVPYTVLDSLEKALDDGAEAAVPVVTISTHIAKVADNTLDASIESQTLHEIQSPQLFTREALQNAYGKLASAGGKALDDAALVRLTGGKVVAVPGSPYNVRIGSDELVKIGSDYLKHLPKPRKAGPLTPFDEAQW